MKNEKRVVEIRNERNDGVALVFEVEREEVSNIHEIAMEKIAKLLRIHRAEASNRYYTTIN